MSDHYLRRELPGHAWSISYEPDDETFTVVAGIPEVTHVEATHRDLNTAMAEVVRKVKKQRTPIRRTE